MVTPFPICLHINPLLSNLFSMKMLHPPLILHQQFWIISHILHLIKNIQFLLKSLSTITILSLLLAKFPVLIASTLMMIAPPFPFKKILTSPSIFFLSTWLCKLKGNKSKISQQSNITSNLYDSLGTRRELTNSPVPTNISNPLATNASTSSSSQDQQTHLNKA